MGKRNRRQSDSPHVLSVQKARGSSSWLTKGSYPRIYCDLNVPLVSLKKSRSLEDAQSSQLIERKMLLHRLDSTGYTHAAVTHTVYGAPHVDNDKADTNLPLDSNKLIGKQKSIQTLRRLHAVIENLSDASLFVKPQSTISLESSSTTRKFHELINEYDIVSLAPGNEATFQEVCKTATAAEIISLDYTMSSGGTSSLPYRIKGADIRAAMERGAVFEICYSPALLNEKLRRKLIQCCRDFQNASIGLRPRLVISSGVRALLGVDASNLKDAGDMALRTPGDMKNLAFTILGFGNKVASEAFSGHAEFAIHKGMERRFGHSLVRNVHIVSMDHRADVKSSQCEVSKKAEGNASSEEVESVDANSDSYAKTKGTTETTQDKEAKAAGDSDDDEEGDGFIAF